SGVPLYSNMMELLPIMSSILLCLLQGNGDDHALIHQVPGEGKEDQAEGLPSLIMKLRPN
ncbi:MAG: hypothetical protein ACOVR6_00250, partial [Fimbriimonas sp.]